MTSHQRVLLTVNHQMPDRIPVDFWASRGFLRALEAETGLSHVEFLDADDVDLRYLPGPKYVGPPLVNERGEATDLWGVPRTVAEVRLANGVERYEEVTQPPLASLTSAEEVLTYPRWPSPDWYDYSVITAQAEAVLAQGRGVAFMGDRLNRIAQLKPAMYLRGLERILVDLALAPELANAIFGKIRAFYLSYLERMLEAAGGRIDVIVTGDDFGAQDGLLVSEPMWNRFLREGFAAYIYVRAQLRRKGDAPHLRLGARPDPAVVESGLDVLQSLQPEAKHMAPAELKTEYGDRLAFQGGVSIQRTMPFGTREEIRGQVRLLAETMGRGGGYIFGTSHNLQADVPVGNVLALLEATGSSGGY